MHLFLQSLIHYIFLTVYRSYLSFFFYTWQPGIGKGGEGWQVGLGGGRGTGWGGLDVAQNISICQTTIIILITIFLYHYVK